MRVTRFGALALGFATLMLTITLAGCGGGGSKDSDKTTDSGGKDKDQTTTNTPKKAVKSGKGTFKGMVKLVGDKPDIAALNKALAEQMEKASATDKPHCLAEAPKEDKEEQDWKIGSNDGVADVFVYLKPVKDTFFAFEASDEVVKAAKEKPPELHQPHCAFHPHALIAFPNYRDSKDKAQKTGQQLIVHNDAKMAHNTKIGDVNESLPVGAEKKLDIAASQNPIGISCSVHPWMSANLLALDNPYAAVTNDKGEFEIKNVPAGKVMVIVMHIGGGDKQYGNTGGAKGEEIELKDTETTKNFEVKK